MDNSGDNCAQRFELDTLYSVHDTEVLFVYTVTRIIYSDTIVSLNLLPCIQMKYLTIFLLMTRANNNNDEL